MTPEKINYKVARDFGETFNISIQFLRQNFRLLFQSLLFIAGPFLLLSAIANAYYQADMLSHTVYRSINPLTNFGISYFLYLAAASLASLATMGTIYSFMLLYAEKGPRNFTVNDVARRLAQNAGNILGVFFLFTFLIVITIVLVAVVVAAVGSAFPPLVILLVFGIVIGMLILMPPFFWQLSVVYLIKMEDNDSAFDCYGRTRYVMKSNFWWTWLIMVCTLLAVLVTSLAFSIPQIIYQSVISYGNLRGSSSEASVPFMAVTTVCTFFSSLIYSVLYIFCAFHYYSLAEKKDGTGLMERINEIGQTPVNHTHADQQY